MKTESKKKFLARKILVGWLLVVDISLFHRKVARL